MSNPPVQGVILNRPGLPVDPLLQLGAGQLVRLPDLTLSGLGGDTLLPPNPLRVALYVWDISTSSVFTIGPAPGPIVSIGAPLYGPLPLVVHCRDYPGMVQGAWVITGMVGAVVGVAEYLLQPWWGM